MGDSLDAHYDPDMDLLDKVFEQVSQHPETWGSSGALGFESRRGASIAGWVLILGGFPLRPKLVRWPWLSLGDEFDGVRSAAQRVLRLIDAQAEILFSFYLEQSKDLIWLKSVVDGIRSSSQWQRDEIEKRLGSEKAGCLKMPNAG